VLNALALYYFGSRNLIEGRYSAQRSPDKRLVMRTSDGPFPMETTYEWAPTETGTRMTLRNRGTPSGFSWFVAPFMSAAMRRANKKDLAALKALLEATSW
jgi:polyketide cyclase/dehydrase/lipid transport protein